MSIRKRGCSYSIRISNGYQGKTQLKTDVTLHLPKDFPDEAGLRLAEQNESLLRALLGADADSFATVSDLAAWYTHSYAPRHLKPRSLSSTRQLLSAYVLPRLGGYCPGALSAALLDDFFSDLRTGGVRVLYALRRHSALDGAYISDLSARASVSQNRLYALRRGEAVTEAIAQGVASALGAEFDALFVCTRGCRPLSPSTINRIRSVISAMFGAAVRHGRLARNPIPAAAPLRADKREHAYIDGERIGEFLSLVRLCPDEQFRRMVELLLQTGMRIGELLALRWCDVCFAAGHEKLTISHTLCCLRGSMLLTSPKSASGKRVIYMTRAMLSILTEQRAWQQSLRSRSAANWDDADCVFSTPLGGHLRPSSVDKLFAKYLSGTPFSDIRPHALRHTTASLLYNAPGGMAHAYATAAMLGHSNPEVTRANYCHEYERTRLRERDFMNAVLPQERP